jgi:rRNA maturation RNase YbeY
MSVSFHFLKSISLDKRTHLKAFLKKVAKTEGFILDSLDIIFCDDEYLLKINKGFLKHNYYTDIITFDLSERHNQIVGELYISVDTVKQNALELRQTIKKELHRVIFHGLLHLCGYKDKKPGEKKVMTSKENKYLALYFS